MDYIDCDSINVSSLFKGIKNLKRKAGNNAGKTKTIYKDCLCAFDIETTNLTDIEQAVMYIWQFQLNDTTIIGRTWEDFKEFLEAIKNELRKNKKNPYIVVYVHNLSFEFQFLKGIFNFGPEDVFALDNRKIAKAYLHDYNVEFRCSYLLTNMSLKTWLNKMQVEDKKLDGYDYSKKRYSDTSLSEFEINYCINDVKGLVQALKKQLEIEDDNLYTVPLTSTGYVRRDVKRAIHKDYYINRLVYEMYPDLDQYQLLKECFRGGNTHANRYFAGIKIDENDLINSRVYSVDIQSAYPFQICTKKFPMSKFKKIEDCSMNNLLDLIYKQEKACMFRIKLYNCKLRNAFNGNPYLPKHKCNVCKGGLFDNGRVLSADYLNLSLTDIDFKIVLSQYEFEDCEISDLYVSNYGYLPKPIREVVLDYFERKTSLKGVEGQELFYNKAKAKLNAIYGMMATDPIKQDCYFEDNQVQFKEDSIEVLLEKNKKKSFLAYAWGVWVTAHTRLQLQQLMDLTGDNFVYCDTDSVKFVASEDSDIFNKINDYNKANLKLSKRFKAYAKDRFNKIQVMGQFEKDAVYDVFKTYGAKKYCSIIDNKLTLTVAGVSKKEGAEELLENGGIDAFRSGFIFRKGGGVEAIYNDDINDLISYEGRELKITSNICLKESTYTLSLTDEYANLLNDVEQFRFLFDKVMNKIRGEKNYE